MKSKLALSFCLLIQFVHGQNKDENFFVFDADWKPVDIKKAVYLLRVRQTGDSSWEWLYYNLFGPRIKKECFKDMKATVRNGKFLYYNNSGIIDSSGYYYNGERDGTWAFTNSNGEIIRKKEYDKGILLKDTVIAQIKKDPVQEPALNNEEIESTFPGNQEGWGRYLNKNLRYPERAINSRIQGDIILEFIIDKNGNVESPEINRSVEYSLDEEALRIIRESPKWTPAFKYGERVKSYKKQPIKFRLQ